MAVEYKTAIQNTIDQIVTNGLGYEPPDAGIGILPLDIRPITAERAFTDDWELQIHLGRMDQKLAKGLSRLIGDKDLGRMTGLYLDISTIGRLNDFYYPTPEDLIPELHGYCCVREELNKKMAMGSQTAPIFPTKAASRRVIFRPDVFIAGGYDKLPPHRAWIKDSDYVPNKEFPYFTCSGKCH